LFETEIELKDAGGSSTGAAAGSTMVLVVVNVLLLIDVEKTLVVVPLWMLMS